MIDRVPSALGKIMSILRNLLFAFAAVAVVAPAQGAETQKFSRAAFNAAQAQGRPILVDVKAWWCPVCASQNRTIKAALTAPQFAKLVVFELDYDGQKPEWQAFSVRKQATLIAFRGGKELSRLEFVTDKAQINALLASTVR
jgi:thioredoxin 1